MARIGTGYRVAALVADGFEQVELTGPKEALEAAGATVELVSLQAGEVQGFHHLEKGDRFAVGSTLEQANPEEFDALLLPGGLHSPDQLRGEEGALEFIRAFDRDGKPIAAICHGPWLLVSTGIARDRRLTSYHTIKDDLVNAGAQWEDAAPITDGNLVTARNPDDIPQFNAAMLELFGLHAQDQRRAA